MATTPTNNFPDLIKIAREKLENILYERIEQNQQRAIYEIHGVWKNYDIRLKEIYSNEIKMYSYYVLQHRRIILGFDNYPDKQVLKQRYGQQFSKHLSELIAHKHGLDKQTIEMTEEINVIEFFKIIEYTLMF